MARDFDGVDDTVLRDNADVTQADADFTACFWAFADTEGEGGAGRHFIIRNSGGTAYFGMQYASPGVNRPRFFMRFGTDVGVSGANGDAPLSTWTHWAVRFRTSDNLLELIKDGVVLASLTSDPGTTASAGQCIVGANDTGGGNDFDGRIADFRWWNSTRLSDVEVAMVMRGMVVRPGALTIWWPLWGTTSPEPDWSGANRHGTVTGATRIDHPPGISAYWLAPHPRRVQRVTAAAAFGPDEDFLDLHSRLHVPHWREPHVTVYS